MKKFLVSLAVAALAVPMFAQGTPQRFAVIEVQRVLAQSSAGKSAYDKLKKMQEEREERAKAMVEELRKLDNDLTTKRLSLSEEKLAEIQKQLADKRIEVQRFQQDAERELGEAQNRELQALEAKIKPVIDAMAKEMGLAAIFNKFDSGIVWASEAVDITDTVIKRFNDANPAAAPAAAPAKK